MEDQVLKAIADGKNNFTAISLAICHQGNWSELDKCLQKLRRAGKIKYTGQRADAGWKIKEMTAQRAEESK